MLGSSKIVGFAATRDPAAAKSFYRDILGLRLVGEDSFALVFDAHGTSLRVQIVTEVAGANCTVLGWEVDDIAAAARDLRLAGVALEHYEGLGQDELGIWTAPSGAKVAWFRNPDGNILSITQFESQTALH